MFSRSNFFFLLSSRSAGFASLLQLQRQEQQQQLQTSRRRRTAPTTTFADEFQQETQNDSLLVTKTATTTTTTQTKIKSDLNNIQREAHELYDQEQKDDDFFVIDNPLAPSGKENLLQKGSELLKDMSGNINHLSKDSVEFVADEFKRLRDLEVIRRKKILAELATPNPMDYQYDEKLVPVPPLNFGKLAPQSYELAQKMLAAPTFSKVREALATERFFEINDMYCEIAFIGRANSGKSSLINAILGQPALAKTSSVPHSTRKITFYQSVTEEDMKTFSMRKPNSLVKLPGGGLQFTLVDVPGFGLDGMSSKWRDNAISLTDSYFGQRRSVNTVFMCIDAQMGVTPTDVTYFEWMTNVHGVFWIILTKCDKIPHTRLCTVMNHLYTLITNHQKSDKYRKIYPFVLPVSAHTGENIDFLRALIVETSGVLPADTLRKLLQQRNGSKWFEAVREEEDRLLQESERRHHALAETHSNLMKMKQLLPAPPKQEEGDDFILIDQQQENEAFGVYESPLGKKTTTSTSTTTTTTTERETEVLSFEVPDSVVVTGTDNKGNVSNAENQRQRIGQFKLSAKMSAARPEVAIVRSGTSLDTSGNSTNSFAQELAQKLSQRDGDGDSNRFQQQRQSNSLSFSSFHESRTRAALKRRGGAGAQVMIETSYEGNLVDANQELASLKVLKSRGLQKLEKRRQRQLDSQSKLSTWQRFAQNEAGGDAQDSTTSNAQDTARALRKMMTSKERASYMENCGGTLATGEKLVEHTQQQMAVGEQRAAPTMRRAGGLTFNHAGRLPLNAQPGGLWSQYGSANPGKVNSSSYIPATNSNATDNGRRVLGW